MINPISRGEINAINPLTSEAETCFVHAASGAVISVAAEIDFESVEFGSRVRVFGNSVVRNAVVGPDSVIVSSEVTRAKLGVGVLLGVDTLVKGVVDKDELPLLIEDFTTVDGASITGKSAVGSDTRIGAGVSIVDSIIGSGVRIRETKTPGSDQPPLGFCNQKTTIVGSIIGDGSDLGSNSFTQFCVVGSNVVIGELTQVTADLKDGDIVPPGESRYKALVIHDPIELPKPSRFARFRKTAKY